MSKELVEQKQQLTLTPRNIEEALKFADMLSKSSLVPKEFSGNSGNILVAIQWGMELGLQPMQAMQNIAVINGRPALWGDAVIALVKASPLCEYIVEETNDNSATCKVKRKGEPWQSRTFTVDDAKKAGLWSKGGVWTNYPKRMMQMRARSWALRDVFPDVLRGMPIAEELQDMERDVTPAVATTAVKEVEHYSNDEFYNNEKAWKEQVLKAISKGSDAESFIIFIEKRGKLFTEEQKAKIRAWKPIEHGEIDDTFVADMNNAETGNENN